MTTGFIKSATCNCEPTGEKKLAITEGHTTIWVCIHADLYEMTRREFWELKK